jgi:nucleoside diphosphate kinase
MASNRTFTMIKPHAVTANNIGGITAKKHNYQQHKLVNFMKYTKKEVFMVNYAT